MSVYYQKLLAGTGCIHERPWFELRVYQMNTHKASGVRSYSKGFHRECRQARLVREVWLQEEERRLKKSAVAY